MLPVRKTLAVAAAVAAVAGLASACGSSGGGGGGSSAPQAPASTGTSTTPAGTSSSGAANKLPDLHGKSFTVLGQWTGEEQKAFQSVIDAFDKATGATGHYTAAPGGDEATVLGAKVNGGTPPDIAILALPGAIAQYANAGKLKPMPAQIQQVVSQNFASEWAKLATVKGKLYGVPVDASDKSTVWYNTKLFSNAGLSGTPATWADFIKDAKTINASGVSVPIAVGGGDGWTLTDWFENVYIRTAGLDNYDKLTHHQIPWTDPSVTKALTTLKQVWGDKQLVGSPASALKVTFPGSVDAVFKKNPTSAIVYEASFVATQIAGDKLPAKVGVDAKFFPFPSINGSKPVVEAAGDFANVFTSNEAAMAFAGYLGTPEAAKLLVSYPGSGFISANKNLDTSAYPDATTRDLAKQIVSVGDNFRFDMSDQAPAEFGGTPNKGEWAILQTFLKNGNVSAAQQALESAAKAAKGW